MSIIEPITEDDMKHLGFNGNTSLSNALNMVNNIPISQEYDDKLDLNAYIVGWEETVGDNVVVQRIFSKKTVSTIQEKTSEYLVGLDRKGRKIVPSERVVVTALYGVFRSHFPQVGDIYGRYQVMNDQFRNDYAYIVDKTISLIVRGIRDEIETIENNEKLTIWTTMLGDFNEHQLRSHPWIKTREKRPDAFQFHMRY